MNCNSKPARCLVTRMSNPKINISSELTASIPECYSPCITGSTRLPHAPANLTRNQPLMCESKSTAGALRVLSTVYLRERSAHFFTEGIPGELITYRFSENELDLQGYFEPSNGNFGSQGRTRSTAGYFFLPAIWTN